MKTAQETKATAEMRFAAQVTKKSKISKVNVLHCKFDSNIISYTL